MDLQQQKEAFKVVSNVILSVSLAQLNMIILPSTEKMSTLFERLIKAIQSLKTNSESVSNFFECVMRVLQSVD